MLNLENINKENQKLMEKKEIRQYEGLNVPNFNGLKNGNIKKNLLKNPEKLVILDDKQEPNPNNFERLKGNFRLNIDYIKEKKQDLKEIPQNIVKQRESEFNSEHFIETETNLLTPRQKIDTENLCKSDSIICYKDIAKLVRNTILSKTFSLIVIITIVIILFIDCIRRISLDKNYDYYVDMIILIIYCFISLEILLFFVFIPSYRFSFFFWLDIASILGLSHEIIHIFTKDEDRDYASVKNMNFFNDLLENSHIAKTSKASISGTKAGRIASSLKIIRLFSLVNFGKGNQVTFVRPNYFFEKNKEEEKLKLKEMIRFSRRSNIVIKSNQDKIKFFKNIHLTLNTPYQNDNNLLKSKINPNILKNYLPYALSKEKRWHKKNGKSCFINLKLDSNRHNPYHSKELDKRIQENPIINIKPLNGGKELIEVKKRKDKKHQSHFNIKEIEKGVEQIKIRQEVYPYSRGSTIKLKKLKRYHTLDKRKSLINKLSLHKINVIEEKCSIKRKSTLFITENLHNKDSKNIVQINESLSNFNKRLSSRFNYSKTFIDNYENDKIFFCYCLGYSELNSLKLVNQYKKGFDKIYNISENEDSSILAKKSSKKHQTFCFFSNRLKLNYDEFLNDKNLYKQEKLDPEICMNCEGIILKDFTKNINNLNRTFIQDKEESHSSKSSLDYEEIVHKDLKNETLYGTKLYEDINLKQNNMSSLKRSLNTMIENRKTQKDFNNSSITLDKNSEDLISLNESDKIDFVNTLFNEEEIKIPYYNRKKTKKHPKIGNLFSKKITIKMIVFVLLIFIFEPLFNYETYIENNEYAHTYLINLYETYLSHNITQPFVKFIEKISIYNSITNSPFLLIGFSSIDDYYMFFDYKGLSSLELKNNSVILFRSPKYYTSRKTQSVLIKFKFLYAVYDISNIIKIDGLAEIGKIIFTALILWVGSFFFLLDINGYIIKPLEYIINKIISHMNHMDMIVLAKGERSNELEHSFTKCKELDMLYETIYISKFISKSTLLLHKIHGNRAFKYLSSNFLTKDFNIKNEIESILPLKFETLESTIMVIKFKGLSSLINLYKEEYPSLLSKIINLVELCAFEYFGEMISFDDERIILIWDETKYKGLDNINKNDLKNSKSISEIERELDEEYHSFKIDSHKSSFRSEQFLSNLSISNDKYAFIAEEIEREITACNSYCIPIIAALKIISRLFHNQDLATIFQKNVKLRISLHNGRIFHYILNTSVSLESRFTGLNIKKALYLNNLMNNYDITLLISEDIVTRLNNNLKNYYREIDRVYDEFTGKEIRLYCIDVLLDKNNKAAQFTRKLSYSKEESLLSRNYNTKGITEKRFNLSKIIRYDPEINLIRPKSLNTFVKYFQFGYEFYLIKSYDKAKEALRNALYLNPLDKRTKSLLERIGILLKNNGTII